MFPVEIRIPNEEALAETMQTMRTWLDHQRFEPLTFRYTFETARILFRVDFALEAEAAAFARAFEGKLVVA
jgi:hypothetical protein